MNRKSIIFDFDGTLIDNTERDYQSFYYVFKKYKMNILNKEEVMEMRKKGALAGDIIQKAISISNYKSKQEDLLKIGLQERQKFLESDLAMKWDIPFAYTTEVLNFYKKNEYYIFLTTLRKNKSKLMDLLKQLGILKFFDAIYCIDDLSDEERSKSNSWRDKMIENKETMFCKIVNNKRHSNDVLAVGDTIYDMIAGNKAGITTIGVLTGYARKEDLLRYANLVLPSIKELQKIK